MYQRRIQAALYLSLCCVLLLKSAKASDDETVFLTSSERIDKSRKRLESNFKKLSKRRIAIAPTRKFSKDFFIRSGTGAIFRPRLFRKFIYRCGRQSYRFRRNDGSCNNWRYVKRGAAGTVFKLFTRRASERGSQTRRPSGGRRPSARVISNLIHKDVKQTRNRRKFSEMVVFFGQFLDHSIAETENDKKQKFNIPIPKNDKYFKRSKFIPFVRSVKKLTRRGWAPVNNLPSFIDAAVIYGAQEQTGNILRVFKDGKLKTNRTRKNRNMLPQDKQGFFMSGDRRVNENPNLIAMHTIFMREHNRLCGEIKRAFPWYSDELTYQTARKINGALMQSIVYYEFLPAVLGSTLPYTGPRSFTSGSTDPSLSDEFSVMAFRVGHTMVNSHVTIVKSNGRRRRLLLRDAFFKPSIFNKYRIDDLLRGVVSTRAAEVDVKISSELRNFLFGRDRKARPLDLCALNIQRGRDHRLPSYVRLRRKFGLPRVTKFSQITRDRRVQRALRRAYGRVELIDGFTGGLAEDHCCGGSLGPLFRRIWVDQFQRLRNGDRFYFEKLGGFTKPVVRKVPTLRRLMQGRLQGKTMGYILARNTKLSRKHTRNVWFA